MNKERFYRLSQFLLIYTLLVILWGAWVRISHSGDGCGDTWPLCHGQIIPLAEQKKTWVEYGHRVSSGLYGIFVFFLYWLSRQVYPKKCRLRVVALMTLIFTITEALLGAKLVLFKLVGSDTSGFRVFAMSLHQINSLFLTGSVALMTFWSLRPEGQGLRAFFVKYRSGFEKYWIYAFLLISVAGAWASLSTTLFPSSSLLDGLQKDFDDQSHFLLQIRLLHPVLAVALAGLMSVYCYKAKDQVVDLDLKKSYYRLSISFALAILFGILTLLFLYPTWMKITHLAIAHGLWILWINHVVISLDSANR